MDTIETQYGKIPHDTIQGIKKRFIYWRDENNSLIRCANREEGMHWYRNYYYKGHSYFALADFLQMQHTEVNATWDFSNAKDFVTGKKNYGKQILNTKPQKIKQKHIPTTNAFTFREQQLYKMQGSLVGGGMKESISMKNEMLGHLYHLSLEYLFKSIWLHSNNAQEISKPIHTHDSLYIFNHWDKELQIEVKKYFDNAVDEHITSRTKTKDAIEDLLKIVKDVEVGLNRYSIEPIYPSHIKIILQDIAEFFFIHLFPLKDVAGYDNEPLFTEVKGRNNDTNKKMSLKFWVHQPPNTK